MSRTRGKREAAGGWHTGGDPFREERAPKRKKTGMGRGAKIALITLAVVAGLALVAVGAWKTFVKPMDVSNNVRPNVQGDKEDTPAPQTPSDADKEVVPTDGRKENYFTFLLLGKDTSSGSTDTIMLVSYDVNKGEVNVMSIPRDTMVNLPHDMKRINSVYSSKQGLEGLKTHIGYLTGVVPDAYVMVEWEAVGRIVEALGGVQFDVPFDMNYDDPYQNLHIHQKKGSRLLNGEDAMQVVRWRKNNDGTNYGDTTRVEVQQSFLKAVAKQCLQIGNWTKVSEFAKIFAENVETDLKLNNLLWFAQKAMSLDMDKIQFMTLPGEHNGYAWSRTYQNNQSYVFADPAQVVEMVNQYFNPYTTDITEDDLQIMYKNKNGSLGVTNGTLADEKAASAPVKPPKPPKQEEPAAPQEPTPPAEGGTTTDPGAEGSTPTDPGTEGSTPTDPGTEGGATTDPNAEGGTATDPGTAGGETTEPGDQGGTATDPGAEPELPPEPTLPPVEGGDTPAEPTEGVDTQPPDWL